MRCLIMLHLPVPPQPVGLGRNNPIWKSHWLRFLPKSLTISRSGGDTQHPQEGRHLGSAKGPWHEGVSPAPSSLRGWALQRVRFQSALTIFIAWKCKGSNETLTPDSAPQVGERARGCLGGVPWVAIPSGPPPSLALPPSLPCENPLMQGANIPPNLITGKNNTADLESTVVFVFSPLWKVWCPLLVNNPKQKWFYLYFSPLFPSLTELFSDYWTTLSQGLLMLIKTTQSY